jgi:hypothetical protein
VVAEVTFSSNDAAQSAWVATLECITYSGPSYGYRIQRLDVSRGLVLIYARDSC